MINIDISMGRHTMKVPYGMKKLFEDMCLSLGITQGNFRIHLGENKKGSEFQQGVKFIELLPEVCAIRVKAQTKEKNGMHICLVQFPGMYKGAELARFAELLKNKFGQAEVTAEELIEEVELVPVASNEEEKQDQQIQHENNVAKIIGIIPIDERTFQTKPSEDESLIVVEEIFNKCGTSWASKQVLFDIIRGTGVKYPENKLIGIFFRQRYLEKNPDDPDGSSRLTQLACRLINKTAPAIAITDDEDVQLLIKKIKEMQEATGPYFDIIKKIKIAIAQLGDLEKNKVFFETELSRISMQIKENSEMIHEKEGEIISLEMMITPRMLEASRRLEILSVDLPA